MVKHIQIAKLFGVPVVVAINKFHTDTDNEVELLRKVAVEAGAEDAVMTDHWAQGGGGSIDLAEAVMAACEQPKSFQFLYPLDMPLEEKIRTIATKVYGADDILVEPKAKKQLALYEELGYGNLPICMAKTHLSLSHLPALKNVPTGFTLPVREVRASLGAGFVYPLCGNMMTMPGLPSKPAFEGVDVDLETGRIKGLF
jgi:formyltetrahydrofolate synthetase